MVFDVTLAFAPIFCRAYINYTVYVISTQFYPSCTLIPDNLYMFIVSVKHDPEACLGHLKQYKIEEIRKATNNFKKTNILGHGGYGIVYQGDLDGTIVAIKRLKDHHSVVGDDQFHTEIEVISLAVHRNLLHLTGFCITNNERLLVYPYMPNGTVSSKLKG